MGHHRQIELLGCAEHTLQRLHLIHQHIASAGTHEELDARNVMHIELGKGIHIVVVVRRDNDDMENRCDAMLSNADNLVFVELKNERQKWFPHAVEQLQKTIDVFKQYNDVSMYKRKRAYACNVRHPNFAYSNKEQKQKFLKMIL